MSGDLRNNWPLIQTLLDVGLPLGWGGYSALVTRNGLLKGSWLWTPLAVMFPLLSSRLLERPAWQLTIPLACWLWAALSVRTGNRSLYALGLLATGASTASLQLLRHLG